LKTAAAGWAEERLNSSVEGLVAIGLGKGQALPKDEADG